MNRTQEEIGIIISIGEYLYHINYRWSKAIEKMKSLRRKNQRGFHAAQAVC